MGQPWELDSSDPSRRKTLPNKLAISPSTPTEIKAALSKKGIHLRKKYGQHLMVSHNAIDAVLRAGEISGEDQILEVGTGTGILTQHLAERCSRVVTVEIDSKLQEIAQCSLGAQKKIIWISGDILKVSPIDLQKHLDPHRPIKVISNPPYNISSPLIEYFIGWIPSPTHIVFTLQKEVVDRMRAKPGTKDYGSLSLFTQFHFDVKTAGTIPPSAFFPQPEVDSSIVVLNRKQDVGLTENEKKAFFKIVRAVFQKRRKTLLNGLKGVFRTLTTKQLEEIIRSCGHPPMIRGEKLSLDNYKDLAKQLVIGM